MIHNASIEQYREPVGAVTKGEEVKLRLLPWRELLSLWNWSYIRKITTRPFQ